MKIAIISFVAFLLIIGNANGICQNNCWCRCFNSPSTNLQPYYSQFRYLVEQAIARKQQLGSGGTYFNYDITFSNPSTANLLRPLQTNIFSMIAMTLPVDNNFNPFSIAYNGRFPSWFEFWSPFWNCRNNCDAVSIMKTIDTYTLPSSFYNNYPNYISNINYWNNGGSCMRNKNIFLNRRMDIVIGNNGVFGPGQLFKDISITVGSGSTAYSGYAFSPYYYFNFNGMMSTFTSRWVSERIVSCMRRSCCRSGRKSEDGKETLFMGTTKEIAPRQFSLRTDNLKDFIEKLKEQRNKPTQKPILVNPQN